MKCQHEELTSKANKSLYRGVYRFLCMKVHEGPEYGHMLKILMDFPDDVKNLMRYLAKERNVPFEDAPSLSSKGIQFKSGS